MKAHPGDTLVISGHQIGEPQRIGHVTEVRGTDGGPPYCIEWMETGHTTLLFPGPDCSIQSMGERANAAVGAQITLSHAREEPGRPAAAGA